MTSDVQRRTFFRWSEQIRYSYTFHDIIKLHDQRHKTFGGQSNRTTITTFP